MKKITHVIIIAMIAAGATAFIAHKSNTPTPVPPANIVWFNTIAIAEGITVEFEYGSKLQVYVEGDKALVDRLALVLENQVLKATGKTQHGPVEGIRIKVVSPVLINLARAESNLPVQLANAISPAGQQAPIGQQEIFQVYAN